MLWDKIHEQMDRKELEKLQIQRLKATVENVYYNVDYYRSLMDKAKVKPSDIQSLDDLKRLPFTTKDDLRDCYPYKMFSTDIENVVRIHASSGTTGKPTVVGYTKNDIKTWSTVMARTLYAAGIRKNDILQNAYGYGLFTGGLGTHYGAEMLGAAVIPASGGNSRRQLTLLNDFKTTAICCTPSYAASLMETALEVGVDLKSLPVKIGVMGAEPWTNELRDEIESGWGIKAMDIYGLSEIIGPGVAFECFNEQNGMHINEDHFLVEVVNPETLDPVNYGEEGELVFTTITKEALPLIRYRTRDISRLNIEPCPCGRTFVRMDKVSGRTDDMLIVKGINLFPSQIEAVLLESKGVLPHYQIIIGKKGSLDTIEVQVELDKTIFTDTIKGIQESEKNLEKNIREAIGISVSVKFVGHKIIERSEGKAKRVIDKR